MAKAADARLYAYEPDYAVPPGETLRETLDTLGMTQVDLALRTGLSTKHVNQVIQGSVAISPETSLLLEKATGVPARLWNRLEANYQEQRLRLKEQRKAKTDLDWLNHLPLRELIKRDVVTVRADAGAQLQEVYRFFGVANRKAWDRVWLRPQASFRISKAFRVDAAALAAWLRLGELDAVDIQCQPFDRDRFKESLKKLRRLTTEPPERFQAPMQNICAQSGVAVVFIPEIKGARASGAARWLTPSKALIQLSLRYKWEDHFWFSFFHEAAHILLHGKRETFVDDGNGEDELEEQANSFAQSVLIPHEYAWRLPELQNLADIRAFARLLDVAPGIVVGRLQREGVIPYSWGNRLRRKFELVPKE